MADNENKNRLTTIPIKSLKSKSSVNDSDILVIEDETTTYKTKASDLLDYTRESVKDTFVQLSQKGVADGVVPLDSNSKINPTYLSFGETAGKIYDGKKGKDLETAIANHKADTNNPHKTTKAQIGLGNVENKDSETIRSELTYKNVTDALGFTPEVDGSYENATAYTDQKIAELIGGASSTMDTLKEVEDAMKSSADVVEALNEAIGKKANETEFESHVNDGVIHVTTTDKENISTALSHSKSDHARVDATKTEESTINGNIKINDQETTVYEHPLSGATAGTYRQVTVDAKGHVTGGSNTTLPITQGGTGATTAANALKNLGVTATASELNKLDGVTTTTDELNYVHGVTSGIQTQLDGKAPKNHGLHLPAVTSDTNGKIATSNGTGVEWHELTKDDVVDALGYVPGTGSNVVTAVKGDAEEEYKTGNVNITPASIGLDKVDNTKDNQKAVLSATKLSTARKIGNARFNGTADISLEDIGAMSATNPVGTGSFSMNRMEGSTVGESSFVEGYDNTASGLTSHAEGNCNIASAESAHAEGTNTRATGEMSHAEGCDTIASGYCSHAEGHGTKAIGVCSHASGGETTANYDYQFVVGCRNRNREDSLFEVGNGEMMDPNFLDPEEQIRDFDNAFRVTKNGQAIARTALGIGDTSISEDDMKRLLRTNRTAWIGSDVADTAGWYKVADQTVPVTYGNTFITFLVTSTYNNYYVGLLTLNIRNTNKVLSVEKFDWLSRSGFGCGDVIIVLSGTTWTLYAHQKSTRYGRIQFQVLSEGNINRDTTLLGTELATLYNSSTPEATAPTASAAAGDAPEVNNAAMATCSTAAATAAKIVTISNNAMWRFRPGAEIIVKFTNTNTASNVTLNVNNTGAKHIWYNTSVYTGHGGTICGNANRYVRYVYDGTYWVWMGMSMEYNDNTWIPLKGATASADGMAGYVPKPEAGDQTKTLLGDGTWGHDTTRMKIQDPRGYGSFSLNRVGTVGQYSFVAGASCEASGGYSHAEGHETKATNLCSHAEGYSTTASGGDAHAEGGETTASNTYAHAEGQRTIASGMYSHAEGFNTTASASGSHSSGKFTEAHGKCQCVVGYGNDNQTDSVFEVGNGLKSDGTPANDDTPATIKQNAFRVTQSGEAIAQTGLGIGDTKMTESQLRNLLVYASASTQQSSKKYKKNIVDMTEEDANKLLQLRPVQYDYINELNGTGCYGLIAEEVDEVMSYPVIYDADGNPDGIDYSKFVPLIIKMSQIQEDRINKLEKENSDLKARLDKLEAILTK